MLRVARVESRIFREWLRQGILTSSALRLQFVEALDVMLVSESKV
jgi:hypothetical protein